MRSLDAFFAHYFARNPVTATFTGVHAHDHALPDWSADGRAAEIREMRALHDDLRRESPRLPGMELGLRDNPAALDAELARANLEVRIAEMESGFFHERNPALWTGEAIFGVVSLMIRDFAPVSTRLDAIQARLVRIPEFLAEMRRELDRHAVPSLWRQRAERECRAAVHLLTDGLREWQALHVAGTPDTATNTVAPLAGVDDAVNAFTETEAWLSRLSDRGMDGVACGTVLLDLLIRRGHFFHGSPRELLARAEQAMEVERAALNRMLADRFDGSWSSAQAAMAADRPESHNYLTTFSKRWEEIRRSALEKNLVTWPKWPIRYVPIPAWARHVQPQLYWLFYRSPAPFDRYHEHEYLVAPIDDTFPPEEQEKRLAAWNHSTITLNHVVHHGGLGHHVQNWHASHVSTSRVGAVAAVDAASRIGMFLGGSMAEGWACYATQLAEELGVLTPLEQLSEQHTRVRLLARAIVDLRMHLGDWSFARCVEYYQSTVGMSVEVATAEATKNSMFPATALMYWLGTSSIVEARERLQAAHGAAFSLRRFHDALLSRGAIPAPLASRLV